VLHNVDGAPLRNAESQALLGELAAMPRVHIIASVDHVNAPLLWSKREAARFNWVWQRATTFAPYHLETANVPQLLASKGEERHVRGASNVLRSLTSNARDIFRLLAEHQLQHPDEQGWKFHAFYTACREQFFATSEVTLRSHLTGFTDHELTRYKRSNDGEDLVVIPFAADILGQLLKEIHGV
jgi:origin recognition complex subunit 2